MASNPHYDYGLLRRAIAVSLLLHAVLLLQSGLGTMSSHPAAAPSLMALLRPRAESPVPGAAMPVPASHKVHTPAPAREVSAAASPVTAPTLPVPPTTAEVVGAAAVNISAPGNANDTASGAITVESDAELDFAEARKLYLFAIAGEARRVKKYPARAVAAGWTGTAEILVRVAAGGNVQAPQLRKSSGYADIDNAALSFVGIALKRTPVPERLSGRSFDLVLPVSFTFDDK